VSALAERCQQWRQAFDQRVLRERILMAVAAVFLIGGLLWLMLVDPALARLNSLDSQQQQAQTELAALQIQVAELEAVVQENPAERQRQALNSKQKRLANLDDSVSQRGRELIAPEAMVKLLRELLSAQTKLELVGLDVLKPEPIYNDEGPSSQPSTSGQPEPEPLFYRHGADLRLVGRYLDLLNYIEQLEALDVRLGWELLHYNVEQYPEGQALIRVQTLSLGKAWLGT